MKKKVRRILILTTLLALIFFLGINYYLKVMEAREEMEKQSKQVFSQVEESIKDSEKKLNDATQDLSSSCLRRAKTVAYILQQDKEKIKSRKELRKIAKLVEVDTIHIFNDEGVIVAGTVKKYYGLSMTDGKQIGYFLPMLWDKELSLCQKAQENTAEGKIMQYAASWIKDGSYIVQIGLTPQRVLEYTESADIRNVFSTYKMNDDSILFEVQEDNYEIVGSTSSDLLGKKVSDIGIPVDKMMQYNKGFRATVQGKNCYCIFEKQDEYIIGRVCQESSMYRGINRSNSRLVTYMIIIFGIVIFIISKYLDGNIIRAIERINANLQEIAQGNLGTRVKVETTPEFVMLSGYVNTMVESLVDKNRQLEEAKKGLQLELCQDSLTGLCSRRFFYEQLQMFLNHPDILQHAMFVMIDMDDLKEVNDKYGHARGDRYLQKAATLFSEMKIERPFIVARLGGDEFVILIYGMKSEKEISNYEKMIEENRDTTEMILSEQNRIPLRYSYGISVFPEDGSDADVLLKVADEKMYQEKQRRKRERR